MTIIEQIKRYIADIEANTVSALEKGFVSGEAKGMHYGALAEYDRFWDAFQQNGERENYKYAFYGKGWCNENLYPKYNITPVDASYMFLDCEYKGDLRDLPVTFDFSNCTNMANAFSAFYGLTGVGIIDTTSSSTCSTLFRYAEALQTVEKLILKNDGSQQFPTTFSQCYELQNIVIEGVIGQNIDFRHSTKLSKASITSIINALKADASGKTLTLSETAKKNAFTDAEWNTLVATKSNWTISLV